MALDLDRMDELARAQSTVAGKIRVLDAAGVPRADIARFLGKRYQHVRNVLEGDAQSGGGYVLGKADLSGVREGPHPFERDDDEAYIERRSKKAFWLRVKPDGSLPMPQEFIDLLDAKPGNRIFVEMKDGRLTMMSGMAAHEEARAMVRKYIPADVSLSDGLIEDRRNGKMW